MEESTGGGRRRNANIRAKLWEERFQQLKDFRVVNGHVNVPIGWKHNPQLATWVSTQRHEYSKLKDGKRTRMTESRIERLNEIGFVWKLQRGPKKYDDDEDDQETQKDPPVRTAISATNADTAGLISTTQQASPQELYNQFHTPQNLATNAATANAAVATLNAAHHARSFVPSSMLGGQSLLLSPTSTAALNALTESRAPMDSLLMDNYRYALTAAALGQQNSTLVDALAMRRNLVSSLLRNDLATANVSTSSFLPQILNTTAIIGEQLPVIPSSNLIENEVANRIRDALLGEQASNRNAINHSIDSSSTPAAMGTLQHLLAEKNFAQLAATSTNTTDYQRLLENANILAGSAVTGFGAASSSTSTSTPSALEGALEDRKRSLLEMIRSQAIQQAEQASTQDDHDSLPVAYKRPKRDPGGGRP